MLLDKFHNHLVNPKNMSRKENRYMKYMSFQYEISNNISNRKEEPKLPNLALDVYNVYLE